MKTEDIFNLVKEVVGVAVPGATLAINAVTALSTLFKETGGDPTREQINGLIDKIKSQSAEIQKL